MVVTCDIAFDNNPHGTYFAGQTLTGCITLQADKQKDVKAVILKVNGFAYTHWTESDSSTSDNINNSTTYSGHEDYIASKTYLLGPMDGTQNLQIAPGIHSFNFACQIPLSCPSSFEGFYGHVRYTVRVVLERPWKFDQSYSRCFTVLKVMDLNFHSPLLNLPVHTEVMKTFCCWPCGSAPLMMEMSLPQTGFVPGQEIPVGVLVTNDSSLPIEEIKITLAMLVRYYCQNSSISSQSQRLVVAKLKGEGVLRQCKKSFAYSLRVPATPPTCFNLCRLIQIAYQVELEAKVKGWHRNEIATIPVTIGSVPLVDAKALMQQPSLNERNEVLMVPPAPSECVELAQVMVIPGDSPTPNGGQSLSAHPWAVDASISPPSYEQATHLGYAKLKDDNNSKEPGFNKTEVRDYGEAAFTPLYPVFSIASAAKPSSENTTGYVNNNMENDAGTWL